MNNELTPPPRAAYFTRFRPDPGGGGGSRRAAQMEALLAPWTPAVWSSPRQDGIPPAARRRIQSPFWRRFHEWLALFGEAEMWDPGHRPYARKLRLVSRWWARRLGKELQPDLLLLDDPVFFPPVVARAARLRLPAVAVCHNLEGALLSRPAWPAGPTLATREFDLYRRCKLAVTIAREDSDCLRAEGVPVFFFPYFPPPAVEARLARVREARAGTPKRDLLLLGSTANSATRQGMLEAARWWAEKRGGDPSQRLLVAGFGSERHLREIAGMPGLVLLGPLSEEELEGRLATVAAALCHQRDGGGALTRITEYLLAGVPVLASRVAARSYHGVAGVREYEQLGELSARLDTLAASPADFPPPPAPDRGPLREALRGLLPSGRGGRLAHPANAECR